MSVALCILLFCSWSFKKILDHSFPKEVYTSHIRNGVWSPIDYPETPLPISSPLVRLCLWPGLFWSLAGLPPLPPQSPHPRPWTSALGGPSASTITGHKRHEEICQHHLSYYMDKYSFLDCRLDRYGNSSLSCAFQGCILMSTMFIES